MDAVDVKHHAYLVIYNHMGQERSDSARERRIALYKRDHQQLALSAAVGNEVTKTEAGQQAVDTFVFVRFPCKLSTKMRQHEVQKKVFKHIH